MLSSRTTRRRAAALSAAILSVLAAACGGGSESSTSPPPPPVTVSSVLIAPSTLSITVGSTGTLSASAVSATGATIGGKSANWSSSNTAVATVTAGTVTGVSAGSATITAEIDGKTATAAVTVAVPMPQLIEIVSGEGQRGLTGRALADSIVVRAKTATGAPAANVPLTWSPSGGSLSSTSTTTDANGLARVQWTAGSGDNTATVSMSGSANLTVHANGRSSASCTLSAAGQRMTLGPSDPTLSLIATAPHKVAVVFVDFSDAPAPASDTFQSLMDQIVTPGLAVLNELSYGRVQITPTVVPKWYRMSKTSGSYDWHTYQGHFAYITEALSLADPDFDFSSYDAVYIMTPAAVNQTTSPTFNAGPNNSTSGVRVDGKYFGNGVTFGHDARDSRNLGATILAHETGHMFGLVDLYNYAPRTTGTSYPGDQFQNFGAWSIMSNIFSPAGYLAWERRKLGFLDANQVDCLDGTGGEEVTIQPVETTGGLKAVALPLDASRAVVIEVRAKQGFDANMCSDGVLIYDVDASAANGVNVGSIRPSRTTTSGSLYSKCGAWADATYDLKTGGVSKYTDAVSGISVQLLSIDANGAYRVRVKR